MSASGTIEASGIRAVERAFDLLFRLAEGEPGVSLQQLAREVRCSKSTVHRLLTTLERIGVVERDTRSRQYRLGQRVHALAREAWPQLDLRQLALPHMRRLRDESDETVTLHLIDGPAHVVVEQCESPQEVRRVHPLGQRIPLLAGATAKAILAFLPTDEAARIIAANQAAGQSGPSQEELQDIRSLGYAFSLAERVPGSSAISAPIMDRTGRVCAALSISGPLFRFTLARATRCAPALLQAAASISAALGYTRSLQGGNDHGTARV